MPDVGVGLWPAERNLATEDAAALLAEIAAGRLDKCLLPWIPLLLGADRAAIMEEWKRLAELESDEYWKRQYGPLALVFADLAGRKAIWQEALRGWNMARICGGE